MDAKTCLKKLEYVGVLVFATVDAQGNPQVRNISAVHYEPESGFPVVDSLLADEIMEAYQELEEE